MATDAKTGQPIFGRYSVGVHNVGSYQVAGVPFLTGSTILNAVEHKISFPMVTKSITIIGSSSDDGAWAAGDVLRIHFDSTGSSDDVVAGHHYLSLDDEEESITFSVKCKEIYITAHGGADLGYEVVAELTNIPTASMYAHTGSGISSAGTDPRT